MSRLYYSDSGRTIRFLGEELSRRRHARKSLVLPRQVRSGGMLYVYAHPHKGCAAPLRIAVNGREFHVEPDGIGHFHWLALAVERAHLRPGENAVVLWSDNIAMDGWVLGLAPDPHATGSALSLDGGGTWQNDRMGLMNCVRGEYVLRLRLADESLSDPPLPEPVWESPDCALLDEMRSVVPREIRFVKDPWKRALALSSWVSAQWHYHNTDDGIEYAPWDPLTILSWGRCGHGQEMDLPVVMCTHYGIVFVSAALALGLPARSVCVTDTINGMLGHFISEVWIEQWQKWCQVDANCDIVYVRDGIPLSVAELHAARANLTALARKGPGFALQPAHIQQYADRHFMTGESFAIWAVWPRNDYLSHPELTPTMHGVGAYHEPEWLLAETPAASEAGMFPWRVSAEALQREPPPQWRQARA